MNTLKALAFAALVVIMPVMAQAVNTVPLKPDSANDAPATVYGTPNNGVSIGKTTAPNEALDVVGNIALTGSLKGAGSGVPVSLTSATIGVGAVVSTFTNTGNAEIGGTLAVAGATTLTGNALASGTLTATGVLAANGGLGLAVKTKAQFDALTGVVGRAFLCSDCVIPYSVCVGTGTTLSGWKVSHSATVGCGTDN